MRVMEWLRRVVVPGGDGACAECAERRCNWCAEPAVECLHEPDFGIVDRFCVSHLRRIRIIVAPMRVLVLVCLVATAVLFVCGVKG